MSLINSINLTKPETGRRLAISDVHGCFYTFSALLKQLQLTKEDQLFLVGDMVNRGLYSDKVLDYIIQLKQEGFQLYFIRGNHEQAVLNSIKKTTGQRKRLLKSCNSLCLLENGQIKNSYQDVLEKSYHFIELDRFFLVHAGFNSQKKQMFVDSFSMMNIRQFKAKKKELKGKTIIFGHTPTDLSIIVDRVKLDKRKLCIDNGCANPNTPTQGNLVCLNLDTKGILIQPNLENKKGN